MRKLKRVKPGYLVFDIFNYTFFALFALCCAYPMYYIVINSISNPDLVTAGRIRFFPQELTFAVYMEVLKLQDVPGAVVTSIARTALGTLVSVLSAATLGYIFTKNELKHRKFWYRCFIITMYIGAGLIPTYLNRMELGMLNSFWFIYVIPNMIQPYNMILVKTYMESLPDALEDAAYIDGAGYLKRFIHVVIPLSKPILATIAIFTAVGEWNAYMDTLIYMTEGNYQTLQSILYLYLNKSKALADLLRTSGQVTDGAAMAVNVQSVKYVITTVTLTPIILVYPFFQKYFTKGIMIGAVKG